MDPNNNPVTPESIQPAMPAAPVAPATPAAPASAPVQPAVPAAPAAPAPTAPAAPDPAMSPSAPAASAPAQPISAQFANPNPVNPVINPSGDAAVPPVYQGGIAATDPITMPTPPPAPDPVEQELKAPFTAAAPVPGSIGSAVSVPASEGMPTDEAIMNTMGEMPRTPSVAFNDPALTNETPMVNSSNAAAKPAKKKMSKTTLILLTVVLLMVVVALAAVLFLQLNG